MWWEPLSWPSPVILTPASRMQTSAIGWGACPRFGTGRTIRSWRRDSRWAVVQSLPFVLHGWGSCWPAPPGEQGWAWSPPTHALAPPCLPGLRVPGGVHRRHTDGTRAGRRHRPPALGRGGGRGRAVAALAPLREGHGSHHHDSVGAPEDRWETPFQCTGQWCVEHRANTPHSQAPALLKPYGTWCPLLLLSS